MTVVLQQHVGTKAFFTVQLKRGIKKSMMICLEDLHQANSLWQLAVSVNLLVHERCLGTYGVMNECRNSSPRPG